MLVARPERVERHRAVGQQVFQPLGAEPDGAGKHRQRIGLGDFGDGFDLAAADQRVRERLGGGLEAGAQGRHALAESARLSTVRLRVCSGGSASRIRLGGRHGLARRKSSSPTPDAEENVSQSESPVVTSAWRAEA